MTRCPLCYHSSHDNLEVCPICGALLDPVPDSDPSLNCSDCSESLSCDGNCSQNIWPSDDNGIPDKPALLTTVSGTQLDYELTVSLLRSFGIPTVRDFPNAGQLVKILVGFSGSGMDIYVPQCMLPFARDILNAEPLDEPC